MECGDYEGRCEGMARGPSAVGLQLNFAVERRLPLAFPARVLRKPARPVVLEPQPLALLNSTHVFQTDAPFMNDMDEISYWIHTKRAPCLMNYDNLLKKQNEEARCSKTANDEVPSTRKRRKKRKLSILDEESLMTEKQQNVYFEVSQRQNQLVDSCKSDSLGSDVDFNIKNTIIGEKTKKARKQNNRVIAHKKTKVATSTPKNTVHLRRSLRQAQQVTNNSHLNSSYEIFNSVVSNGHVNNIFNINQKSTEKINKSIQMFAAGDQTTDCKKNTSQRNKSKTTTHLNGQFEDLSDVSGFTANYIRSTKVQSSKTPRKMRCKQSRNLAKESHLSPQTNNMVVCVNKSMSTGEPNANLLNVSTDSSQNVMNLVTLKNNDKSAKIDKTTSMLKFVDTRPKSKEGVPNKVDSKQKNKSNLNVSFQSQSSGTSRYPKRYKNHTNMKADNAKINTRRRAGNKNCLEYNYSDKKENPEEAVVSRTRSGRNIGLAASQRENSVLVVSNSTEQVSSMVSMNVASPTLAKRKKRRTTRQVRKKSVNKSGQSLRRDSLRDKSGFAACFSESDDDSVPLVQRKYFCN